MGEGRSHWSSMVLRKSQTCFFDRHTHPNSMYSNFCHVLNCPEEAEEAFRNCIQYDQGIEEGTCKQYAYLALGETEQAIAVNDSILNEYPNAGCYYDAACLYSRMGRKDEAISYLQQALEKGFKGIKHIESDDDLDNIRKMPAYVKLIRKYKKLYSYWYIVDILS